MSKKIGLICGSLRKNSYNRMIANTIADLNLSATFHCIELGNLPLYNEDLEAGELPASVVAFNKGILDADGIVIVTPEYNSGIPGVLKNALDWASRPPRSGALQGKPVGIVGATPGGLGTALAQVQLRHTIEAMQVPCLPFQKVRVSQVHEKVNAELNIVSDERTKQNIQSYMEHFIKWIEHRSN
ncbi:NADPH-dependent FMN reductase [Paenibacillus assamensis]|uniref:NADPH-dependent FMN reductase n=1 Tax=Paenibacillus assamensis TaxID=311244 RepID=UPI000412E145|nr:NADPH-dependent FMN reductase [Paenibacillus assamensis]